MIRPLLLLIGALVVVSGAASNSRLSDEHEQADTSLSTDYVVASIATYLWNKPEYRGPFVIKGSFAAVAWTREYKPELTLTYNDVDVFVETKKPSDLCPIERGFLSSRYIKGIIPGLTVQLTVVCDLDLAALVEMSDINAVNVGFKVTPKSDDDLAMVPEIDSWSWTSHFEDFIQSQTLQVVYKSRAIHHSAIRLLRKAQEMNKQYRFLDDEEVIHGKVVAPNYMQVFNRLDETYKKEITSRFNLVPLPQDDKWKMLVIKGRETPEPPRNLGGNYFGGQSYGPDGQDVMDDEDTTTTTSGTPFTQLLGTATAALFAFLL